MLNPHSRIITRDRGLLGAQLRRNAARFYRLGSDIEYLIKRTLQAVGINLDPVDADKILFLTMHRISLAEMRIRR
jgi:hypothetical protein